MLHSPSSYLGGRTKGWSKKQQQHKGKIMKNNILDFVDKEKLDMQSAELLGTSAVPDFSL